MNNSVKIIISGQIANDTKYDAFIYPSTIGAEQIATQNNWRRSIFDPRSPGRALNPSTQIQVTSNKKLYAYWRNEVGNYYAIIVPAINKEGHVFNEGTPRDGRLMLSVFTEKYLFSSGRVVIELLEKLEKKIIEEGKANQSEVDLLLSGIEGSLIPDKRENVPAPSMLDAYRTYASEEDLERIFQYPNQEEYNKYKHIFIVSSASLPPFIDANYQRINTPVKVVFNINNNLPQGVRVNAYTIVQNNYLEIKYSKPEYLNVSCNVQIDGTSNQYVSYNGNIVTILDAETAGITFNRGIKINCFSGLTPIGGFKVRYNGRPLTLTPENEIVFDEDKTKYEIIVEASGYKSETVEVTLNDIRKGSKEISLTPKDRVVRITISTPDRNVYDSITIPSNSPIYRYLKEAADQGIAINEYKTKKNKTVEKGNHGKSTSSNKKRKLRLFVRAFLIGLFVSYILYALYCILDLEKTPWPFSKPKTEMTNPDDDKIIDDGPDPFVENDDAERKDAEWLKANDVWDKEKLKSDKFKRVCDYLRAGQVEEILRDNSFEIYNVNGYWSQIIDELKRISSKPELVVKAKSELERIVKNENQIDLNKILNSLKDIKEKQQNNPTPPDPQSVTKEKTKTSEVKNKDGSANKGNDGSRTKEVKKTKEKRKTSDS